MGMDWSSIPPKKGPGGAGDITDEQRVSIISEAVSKWKAMGLTREQVAFGVATMRVESGFNPAARGSQRPRRGWGK